MVMGGREVMGGRVLAVVRPDVNRLNQAGFSWFDGSTECSLGRAAIPHLFTQFQLAVNFVSRER
jgi:hypothetical protein